MLFILRIISLFITYKSTLNKFNGISSANFSVILIKFKIKILIKMYYIYIIIIIIILSLIINLKFKDTKDYFGAGISQSSTKLNKTLLFLITLLNNNNIKKWFVCYGTLLGLVRENSCIDNDDDIDIIIEKSNYDIIKKILIENNFELDYNYGIKDSKNIIKTNATSDYSSIDIYMGDYNNNKNVKDLWNNLTIKDCFLDTENKTFIEKKWNKQNIYYPNNYERILFNRYGKDWKIKKDKKIRQTMKEL